MGGRGRGGAGVGRGNNVFSAVPATSIKVVQRLKEVVNCSEQEIYAMLVECNMDPDETVSRLLSQDSFHEVKSKRDKKKENKDTTDSRPRGVNNNSNRGAWGGSDRYANRGGSSQSSSYVPGNLQGKPGNKRENGTHAYTGVPSSVSGVIGRQLPSISDSTGTQNKRASSVSGDAISLSSQISSGYHQPSWFKAPGQLSMADIVKKGRPQVMHPPCPTSSEDTASKMLEVKDEWPSIEKPAGISVSSVLEPPAESGFCADPLSLPSVGTYQNPKFQEKDHLTENRPVKSPGGADQVRPTTVSSRNSQEVDSGGSSLFDDDSYKNMDAYQNERRPFEHNGAEDVTSSVAASLQQLSIENDAWGSPPEEDKPGVIIPNHLQVHTSDCLHLSFGSFGPGIGSDLSGTVESRPLNDNLEEIREVADDSSIRHSDNRDADFYGDEPLGSAADRNMVHRIDSIAGAYDSSSDSQTEALKKETPEEAAQDDQHNYSSAPDYTFENSRQLNSAFNPPQASPQMQNLDVFSNAMLQQSHTNSLPSTLLPSTVVRESDLHYSPFPVMQSVPREYNNTATSLAGQAISMAEALRAAGISTAQPSQQTMANANAAAGPAVAQHLAMHPYSQPTLPLGHYANMIGYPFLPQSYAYMPSAFQQAFAAGNSTYHQSLAAMLPQYKNNVSVSSLPQSAAVASGYGFGSSSSGVVPGGNYSLNPSSAGGSTIGYDDVLNSQLKDANLLASLQQNENTAAWLQGPGSRTVSAIPGSAYYGYPGQNQQPPGFRQGQQQPSQHYGAVGYPNNIYPSQTGMSLDNQQQNPREGQATKQSQQLWQNSY